MYACITCHVSCPSSFYQLGSHILACTCIWTSIFMHLSWDMSRVFVSLSQASSNDSGSIDVYVGNHPCMHDVFIWCAKLHLNHAFHANFREFTHTMHVRSLALNNVDRVDTCKRARATTHVQTHTHTHKHTHRHNACTSAHLQHQHGVLAIWVDCSYDSAKRACTARHTSGMYACMCVLARAHWLVF